MNATHKPLFLFLITPAQRLYIRHDVTTTMSYDMESQASVSEVVRNVRFGLRTKAELRRCGCPTCIEALKVLRRA